jgi:hypothetical protein
MLIIKECDGSATFFMNWVAVGRFIGAAPVHCGLIPKDFQRFSFASSSTLLLGASEMIYDRAPPCRPKPDAY